MKRKLTEIKENFNVFVDYKAKQKLLVDDFKKYVYCVAMSIIKSKNSPNHEQIIAC